MYKSHKKSSGIWEYAANLNENGNPPFSTVPGREDRRVYICKLCRASGKKQDTAYELTSGNGHFREHLTKSYRVIILTATEIAMKKHAAEIENVRGEGLWNNKIRIILKRKRSNSELEVEPKQL